MKKLLLKCTRIHAKPIKTSSNLDIKRAPLKTPGIKPKIETEPVFKTRRRKLKNMFLINMAE